MDKRPVLYIKLLLAAVILTFGTVAAYADKTVADLTGKDREMYEMFRHLFVNGSPDDFYSYAEEYSKDLHEKGYMMLYYKLLSNKGFYALRHNQVYRAIQFAEALDHEVREDGASDYFYLATGLYGDIYSSTHDKTRGETYFMQALEEVGDHDVKFTMRVYLNLAEMLCLKDPQKALQWAEKSIETSKQVENTDYLSMSLAMKAYIYFIIGNAPQFFQAYQQYVDLRSMDKPDFNHRYDNIMEVAKLAFNKDYDAAMGKVREGSLAVDSSLTVICIYSLQGNLAQGFEAMKRRYIEMDSIYSLIQDANFNQLAAETSLMRTREEAAANMALAKRMVNWMIGLTIVFLFVYLMGRRRLIKKIWARNKDLRAALAHAEESDRICSPDYQLSDKEKRDMQVRISSNVNLITSIINELLELSESENVGVVTDKEKTDVWVNNICQRVIQEAKGKLNTGVVLQFDSDLSDDFKIRTSSYRLKNALTHLVDNAMKFTEKGSVELRCELQDGQVRFIVTDTGCGIKKEDHERIFETFQKGDDFKVGVGLGLPICRRLVNSLGGEVCLDATYTDGARFIISLPCGD